MCYNYYCVLSVYVSLCLCVPVCVCVRACVHACVRVCIYLFVFVVVVVVVLTLAPRDCYQEILCRRDIRINHLLFIALSVTDLQIG